MVPLAPPGRTATHRAGSITARRGLSVDHLGFPSLRCLMFFFRVSFSGQAGIR